MNIVYRLQKMHRTKMKNAIKAAGLNQKKLATAMGLTHETVSRHVNGSTQINVEDAQKYSKILGLPPEFFMFDAPPMDIFGTIQKTSCIQKFDLETTIPKAIAPFSFYFNSVGLIDNDLEDVTKGHYTLYVFNKTPMQKKAVDENALGNLSVFSVQNEDNETKVYLGNLGYEENNRYSFECSNNKKNNKSNLKLNWASPVLNIYYQPKLQNIEIIF